MCALKFGSRKRGEYVITTTAATNSWFFEICEVGGIGCLFFMARGQYSIDMYETSCNLWGYVRNILSLQCFYEYVHTAVLQGLDSSSWTCFHFTHSLVHEEEIMNAHFQMLWAHKMVSIISWWWCCLVQQHTLCMSGPKAWAGICVVEIEKWKPFFSFNTPVWGLPEFMAQSIFQRDCMQCSYSFIYSSRIHQPFTDLSSVPSSLGNLDCQWLICP